MSLRLMEEYSTQERDYKRHGGREARKEGDVYYLPRLGKDRERERQREKERTRFSPSSDVTCRGRGPCVS